MLATGHASPEDGLSLCVGGGSSSVVASACATSRAIQLLFCINNYGSEPTLVLFVATGALCRIDIQVSFGSRAKSTRLSGSGG